MNEKNTETPERASLAQLQIGSFSDESMRCADAMLDALNKQNMTIGQCIDATLMVLASILCQSTDSPKAIAILAYKAASLVVPMTTKTFSDKANRAAMGMDEATYQRELAEVQLEMMQRHGGKAS